ncbi:hypothetical protein G6F65_021084 [Rhizopus arrhizus]|nr:hypothetical protein G6F65_021084 [Rhizopus arrhizus]
MTRQLDEARRMRAVQPVLRRVGIRRVVPRHHGQPGRPDHSGRGPAFGDRPPAGNRGRHAGVRQYRAPGVFHPRGRGIGAPALAAAVRDQPGPGRRARRAAAADPAGARHSPEGGRARQRLSGGVR